MMKSDEWLRFCRLHGLTALGALSLTMMLALALGQVDAGGILAGWTVALVFSGLGLLSMHLGMEGSIVRRLGWGLAVRLLRTAGFLMVTAMVLITEFVSPVSFLLAALSGCYAALFAEVLLLSRTESCQTTSHIVGPPIHQSP